ncbi:major facilitator superfamily domain-containing protein [Aspergillus pseudonomiae]|uniref:Major facilitator superfamily domain-containing protein n=1 Tax=Aspergillus pseudonomiae TaxID=1506151 RepID=A0A5N7DA05_9EURO|nr:major facilitator superfamily domain-containing protein [Aspergillus pseudonomiae]KAB8258475.1 major facilitator superfamily domain-containing protein [Aspergillus pseudonomiae]KAE8403221.1 major facilitator superfamily domain-containing protein [Aspergillus pseudonomiae]
MSGKLSGDDYAVGDLHDDRALLRKVDWRILPVMFLTYFLQFVDKISLNYANVMGLQTDLHMSGNDFSWLATAFFLAYAVAEIPQGILLQKFPITKVLGVNVLLWGVILCCSAAAQNFAGMIALRVLLGMLEAVIAPALTMYTSMWYTRAESTPRYGFWYCGLGMGQIVGGLISFAAQHAPANMSFHGWRIMFVVIGVVNVVASLLVLFVLPENVEKAKFLSPTERDRIAQRLRDDQAGVGQKVFRWGSVIEAFGDLQSWLLVLLTILITIPSGVITTFSSILIKDFGYTSKQSALLNMPSGVVSIVATILSTWAIARGFSRWLAIDVLLIPTLLGSCLMSFLPRDNQAGCLVGIYMVNTTVAPLALIFAWTGANFKGYTMKVSGSSLVSAAFSIANVIGPQTFQAKDAPAYIPAKITIVAVNAGAIVVSTALRIVYGRRNARADRLGTPARSRMEGKLANGRTAEEDVHDDVNFRKPNMSKILVTGANGFIAAHCISLLLSTNHHVRGTVRSEQKATATQAALAAAGVDTTNLELVVIPDPTDVSQFAPAVAGCKGILHLASAFTYDAAPGEFEEKLLIPALKGTVAVCEAASKYPEVRKVVIMSSFAAVYDASLGLQPGKVYTEKDWCPLTYEEGKNASLVPIAYRASKVIAERAAWDYVRDHEVSYQLVTLCPGMVFGKMIHPIESLSQLNASNQIVWDVLKGNGIPPTKAPVWIDVEDLARTSLQALTVDLPSHQRFLVTEGSYDTQEIADIVRKALPESQDRIAEGEPGKRIRDTHYSCDSGKAQLMLDVRFKPLKDSLVALAKQLYALEQAS